MALIEGPSTNQAEVDANKGIRVHMAPRAVTGAYKLSTLTGTMAAALGSASTVFAMRLNPSAASSFSAYIEKLRLNWTTIGAFTTPVTAARRLEVYRGTGASPSGGTAINPTDNSTKVLSTYSQSQFYSGQGGATAIATTAALTVTGITFETQPTGILSLVHVGAAGGFIEKVWEYDSAYEQPHVLKAGEILAVRNPVAMDAAGTWQLGVEVEWSELTP